MDAGVEVRPVGPDDLGELGELFGSQRSTRHCWCAAFCRGRAQFAAGWFGGGNRRWFEATAAASATPMGVLATAHGTPVGWCACGPRSRYAAATKGADAVLADRVVADDDRVWLVACLFVRDGHRGQGLTSMLLGAAVGLARDEGAAAVEGWPTTAPRARAEDAFLGREAVFEHLGFRNVARPAPGRAVMRLDLRV